MQNKNSTTDIVLAGKFESLKIFFILFPMLSCLSSFFSINKFGLFNFGRLNSLPAHIPNQKQKRNLPQSPSASSLLAEIKAHPAKWWIPCDLANFHVVSQKGKHKFAYNCSAMHTTLSSYFFFSTLMSDGKGELRNVRAICSKVLFHHTTERTNK